MSETPLFFRIARPTYGRWLRRKFRISTEGYEKIPQTGPLLLLANHAHTLDPFLISATFNRNVRWVAGAHLFKFYLLRKLLESWVKSISKQQGRSDLDTIKSISKAFKEGGVVGLFPEGTRTWDGEPMGFDISTAKLVRLFKVPVLILNLEGAYALKPRWAKRGRKGSMVIRVKRFISVEELAEMKLKEIDEALQEGLGFDFNTWQAKAQIPYIYKRKAEGVEKLLYLCPACNQSSTIKSNRDKIFCSECGLTFIMDLYDNLVCKTEGFNKIDSLPAWHNWEKRELRSGKKIVFPKDRGVLLQKGFKRRFILLSKKFNLSLDGDRMVVTFKKRVPSGILKGLDSLIFDFSDIQSMIITAKSTLEFYYKDQLWRLRVEEGRSMLKYFELYNIYREGLKEVEEED
ncbi:MAG: lysophospholipid acyltransferase family protein [Sphaerochaetaceae bacterium]|jgi:1-acyl-sn-glycerol-3-phosphate acyltransferase